MCKRIFKEQTSSEGDVPFYKIGTFGGEPDAFITRELYEEYRAKFPYPEVGDMLISASGTIGRIVEYLGEDAYFQDSNIVWFNHGDRLENSFLKCIYSLVKWDGIEGSTIKRLYNDNFLRTKFWLPTIKEQKKIGEYFMALDTLITLHQCKFDFLLQVDVNDWEQRKFSDFTWAAGKRNKDDLDLEAYAITNEHGFIPQSNAHDEFGYMKDTDRKAYNIVEPNSFAYNPARINVGSIGYYEGAERVIVSSLYEVFKTADYVDDRFLWHWFKSDQFPKWITKLQEGSVRKYFYYDKLCECQMLMPVIEEQKEIASSLDRLDTLITLHQHKCIDIIKTINYIKYESFHWKETQNGRIRVHD